MAKQYLIKVNNLSKHYFLDTPNIKSLFFGKNNKKKNVLENINLKITLGEKVGILGKNGSGKSTFLKILSRVTTPNSGEVIMNGRVLSMLETGLGFHPEFTAIENIHLNASMLGVSDVEIKNSLDLIIEFSELKNFLNIPLKKFSNGMIAKLGFAIGIFLPSEILILDEILSVIDFQFKEKCVDLIKNSAKKKIKKTILFVGHNLNLVKKICERGIILSDGKIVFDDKINLAVNYYKRNILCL